MSEALVKKSTFAVKKETTYGVDPVITEADCIRVLPDMDITNEYDMIEVDEVRNTFDEMASIRGLENAGGAISVYLRGACTAGQAPETDVLWECGIGVKNTSTATTTVTGSTTTLLKVASGSGFAVGDAVRVAINPPQVVWITAINGNDLTISPALTSAPASGVAVGAGVHYKLNNDELSSFWATFWRGNVTKEDISGCKIESIAIDIATGEAIKPKFTFKGKAVTVAASACSFSKSYTDTDPLVGLNQSVTIGGSAIACSNFNLTISNELYGRKDITSTGVSKRIRTGRRVEGSFSVLYENKDIYDAFKADTKAEATLILSRSNMAAGQIVAIRIPKLRYIKVPVGIESKIFKYDVSWKAEMTNGEDSLTSVSFL